MSERTLRLSARLKDGGRYDGELEIMHIVLLSGNTYDDGKRSKDTLFVRLKATPKARALVELKHRGPYRLFMEEAGEHYYDEYDAELVAFDCVMFYPNKENYRAKKHRYQAVELYFQSTTNHPFLHRPKEATP